MPQRAVDDGRIDRFGLVDDTDRGETHRYTLAGEWRRSTGAGLTVVKGYAIDYGLDLFSNFTYFLDDPERGDQFEQKDDRSVFGASASQRFLSTWLGRDTESVAGFQGRLDHIPRVGLYHTQATRRLETIREDRVTQSSGRLLLPVQHAVDAAAAHGRRPPGRPLPLRRRERPRRELGHAHRDRSRARSSA